MLKKILGAVVFLGVLNQHSVAVQAIPQIAGSWNVTSTATNDSTCKDANPGDIQSYIWIVSSKADGTVTISVQGETSFPKLEGRWDRGMKTLILDGTATGGLFAVTAATWFKLSIDPNGTNLNGIRRYLSPSQSRTQNNTPCFADFDITAKRQ